MELAFHRKVYEGYETMIAADPKRFIRINADQETEAVTKAILDVILPRLEKYREAK